VHVQAVKEEEEVRAKNQAMVEMLQGDAQERKEQTNARLAALREKIRLKCSDEQAKRLNRAAAQLKTIKAAERNSPDSAAGFCAQVVGCAVSLCWCPALVLSPCILSKFVCLKRAHVRNFSALCRHFHGSLRRRAYRQLVPRPLIRSGAD